MYSLTGKYYEKFKNVKIVWDKKSLKEYGEVLKKSGANSRAVNSAISDLTPKVHDYYKEHPNVKEISICYDKKKVSEGSGRTAGIYLSGK